MMNCQHNYEIVEDRVDEGREERTIVRVCSICGDVDIDYDSYGDWVEFLAEKYLDPKEYFDIDISIDKT